MLNVGIIGYGGMGRFHATELITKESEVNVCGFYDISPVRQELAQTDGYHKYSSYADLLSDPKVDVVLVATPNDFHKKCVQQALLSGKNVICEKPVCLSVADFDELTTLADKKHLRLFVHQNRRWDEDYLILQELFAEQVIGSLLRVESRVQGDHGVPSGWRQEKARGGGMVLDWGVHLLDQIVDLMGCSIKSVYASLSYALGYEVDDGCTAILEFENGKFVEMNVDTTNFIKQSRWYIKGTQGTIMLNDWDMEGAIVRQVAGWNSEEIGAIQAGQGLTRTLAPLSEGILEKRSFPKMSQKQVPSFYQNVIDVTQKNGKMRISYQEVRTVLKIMDAIFVSAEKNQVIQLSLQD